MAPAFIVDGFTEKRIVERICPGSRVRMTNMNGRNVSIEAIAKVASSFLALFRGRHYPVFIIVDREGRVESSETIETSLLQCLSAMGVNAAELIIACPDRMIENWMLADFEYFKKNFALDVPDFEGDSGKARIRVMLREKGVTYHEATVGVEVFSSINPHLAAERSLSFRRFRNRSDAFCPWLRRIC